MTARTRKHTATALLISLYSLLLHPSVQAHSGDLDTTFGNLGRVTTSLGTASIPSSVAIQEDGKIVVAGKSYGEINAFAISRYRIDGSLDATFGLDGKVITEFDRHFSHANEVVIQPDGKIVAVGDTGDEQAGNFAVARYNPDGSLDASFGSRGKVTTDFFDLGAGCSSVVLQRDGRIVTAGGCDNGATRDFALARYNPDGTLDATFGSSGKVTTDFGGSEGVVALTLRDDGKLVAAGLASNSSNIGNEFFLARYNDNGSLDSTFSSGGKVTLESFPSQNLNHLFVPYTFAMQPDGKPLVGGFAVECRSCSGHRGDYTFALARYNPDGSFDASFGSGGRVVTGFGRDRDVCMALAFQPDGKILAGGETNVLNSAFPDFALARYYPDGSLDLSFGSGGKVVTDFIGTRDGVNALTIQPNGKIVAVGYTWPQSLTATMFAVARYDSGLPIPTISSASVRGQKLFVVGENFDERAVVLVDGNPQKTRNDDQDPTKRLAAKKAARQIDPGETVTVRVRNSTGVFSDRFSFQRPAQ